MRLVVISLLIVAAISYDESLGREYWYYSSASYCRDSKIVNWNCG
jgi:hypothetical protein